MRKFIEIVSQLNESISQLNEGVDFHPAVMRQEKRDGKMQTIIDYPEGTTRREDTECEFCHGTGQDYNYDHRVTPAKKYYIPGTICGYCEGKGSTMEWKYDFPQTRIPYMGISLLCDVLGMEPDDSGWVPPEKIPELKRRLIMIINGKEAAALARPVSDEQATFVDRSGEVPQIRRGPRMIGAGMSEEAVRAGAKRLLDIVDWAQKHHTGVSWA